MIQSHFIHPCGTDYIRSLNSLMTSRSGMMSTRDDVLNTCRDDTRVLFRDTKNTKNCYNNIINNIIIK